MNLTITLDEIQLTTIKEALRVPRKVFLMANKPEELDDRDHRILTARKALGLSMEMGECVIPRT